MQGTGTAPNETFLLCSFKNYYLPGSRTCATSGLDKKHMDAFYNGVRMRFWYYQISQQHPPGQWAYCEHNGINSTSFATAQLFPSHQNPHNERREVRNFSSALKVHCKPFGCTFLNHCYKGEVTKKQQVTHWLVNICAVEGLLMNGRLNGKNPITYMSMKDQFGDKTKSHSENHISEKQTFHPFIVARQRDSELSSTFPILRYIFFLTKRIFALKKSIMPAVYRV